MFERTLLLEMVDKCLDKTFIIDQAYALYSVKPVLTEKDVEDRENLIALHSLTKQFMVPGLRIGYATGPVKIINAMRWLRMPWSVNSSLLLQLPTSSLTIEMNIR